ERLSANTGGAAPDGSLILNQITISSGGAIAAATAPYETAAPTTYISGETIERYRGSSPADMFRGTPGVKSGEARNGAGSIDVNIRGMQGMGR
ncbi:TonB-dependent receptor plug domain-containing protein, partial [Salmonella enterica]|nr:TonB-dependent receptor plug domain-containing protein [Salmonella enterica]